MGGIDHQIIEEEVSQILSLVEAHAIYQCKAKHPEWSHDSLEAWDFRQDFWNRILNELNVKSYSI